MIFVTEMPLLRWQALLARTGVWLLAVFLALQMVVVSAATISDIDYRLGEGLRIPDSGFKLGGYASAEYGSAPSQPASAALNNLSLSIWWEGEDRWKFFAEFDSENTVGSGNVGDSDGKSYISLERMYADYALNDKTSIRAGKFLTPVGRWNLVHAAPLVWTTSRPMAPSNVFPTNVTGLMVNGRLSVAEHELEYSTYASNGSELHPNPAIDTFSKVFGLHLNLSMLPDSQLGLSYATFEQTRSEGEHKQLVGVDWLWTHKRYELSAEGVYRFSGKGSAWDERGAFVQLVVPLSLKLYAVGRYESFHTTLQPEATRRYVLGLNYRVTPAIVLKAEWIDAKNNSNNAPIGLLASGSVLF